MTTCPACQAAVPTAASNQLVKCPSCAAEFLAPGSTIIEIAARPGSPMVSLVRRVTLGEEFLAQYELEHVLGRGGVALVFQARRRREGDKVAVKLLLEDDDATTMARFRREGKLLKSLAHPNIITLLDVGYIQQNPYLVMELLGGGSMRARITGGTPQPWRDGISTLLQCLEGLRACHERGILHRDIKPDNVLFTVEGVAKLSDFGIAKDHGAATVLTRTGAVIGTPWYLAPEQARGEKATKESDIFATGITAYELLTGVSPFARPTATESLQHLLHEPVLPLRVLVGDLPDPIAAAIHKCLEKKPQDRPASAQEVIAALREGLTHRPTRPLRRAAPAAPPAPRLRRGVTIGIAAVVLMACAWAILSRSNTAFTVIDGLAGDGVMDDGPALARALGNAPPGARLRLPPARVRFRVEAPVAIDRPVHLDGAGAQLVQITRDTDLFVVSSGSVTLEALHLSGTYEPGKKAKASGTGVRVASPNGAVLERIRLVGNRIAGFTWAGISLYRVKGFEIQENQIENIGHSGLECADSSAGDIGHNRIEGVDGLSSQAAILVSAGPTRPAAALRIHDNTLLRIPKNWAIFARGLQQSQLTRNTIRDCHAGIGLFADSAAAIAPAELDISRNHLESGTARGNAGPGISLAGQPPGQGAPAADCRITGNALTGFGEQQNPRSAAVLLRDTLRVQLADNRLTEPSPTGIGIDTHNHAFEIRENEILDPWTDRGVRAAGIGVDGSHNDGIVRANRFRRAHRSARFVLSIPIYVEVDSTNKIQSTDVTGTGSPGN